MSAWDDQLDALEAHWRLADFPNIPSGELGIERGVGNGEELPDSRLPHVYSFEPAEVSEEVAWGQERITTRFLFDYWTRGKTQQQVATVLDAFEALIQADRTLGGDVTKSRVVGRQIFESNTEDAPSAGRVVRLARVEVETVRED